MHTNPIPELRTYALTAALLAVVRPVVRVTSLASVERAFTTAARWGTYGTSTLTPEEIGDIVHSASERVPGATCLSASVVARTLLAANGHPSELRIGVSARESGIHAHAWVITEGQTVVGGDVDLTEYSVLVAEPRK